VFAVALEAALQSYVARGLDPDRVGEIRLESLACRRNALEDHDARWLDVEQFSFLAAPTRRLVAGRFSRSQRLERELDQVWPPVDRVLPAREVVGTDDLCGEFLR